MKKRIISLLLALIMALSLLPVSVLAADDHTGQVHVTVENTTWAEADGDDETAPALVRNLADARGRRPTRAPYGRSTRCRRCRRAAPRTP